MSKTGVKKTKNFRSLAVTLAIAISVLIIIVLIIDGVFQVYFNFQAQQTNLINDQRLVAQRAADTVKGFVQEKYSIVEAVATLSSLLTVSQEEQKAVLERLLGLEPAFRQLILFDYKERELMRASRLSKLLSAELLEYNKDELFSEVKQKKIYISSVYIDKISSEPMVTIAVPVTDVFGDFKGTLIAETNLKFMWDLVAGMKIGQQGLSYVVDKEGNLLAFSDISRVLKGENLRSLDEVSEFVGGSELTHKDAADISRGINGTYVVTNHAHLVTPDWAVVVELPISEAYGNVFRGVGISALVTLFSLALAIVLASYLSRRITKPIIGLRNAASEMSKGKLETKIEIESGDEIGELAEVFNEMAVRLSAYMGGLEEKVAERTAELDKKIKEISESNKDLEDTQGAMVNLVEDARVLELNLREERDRIRAIITSMGEGLLVVDKKNKISLLNPTAEALLEISFDKVSGQEVSKVVPIYIRDIEVVLEDHPIIKAVKTGKIIVSGLENNFYFQSSSGRKFPVIMVVTPLLGEETSGAVVMFRDISEEKQLEEARISFISVASHQLRTPLTSMRWFSEMLIGGDAGKITEKQKHFVERIYQGTDRMISLVNLLLQIARVEAGRVKIEPTPVDLKTVTRGVLVTLKSSLDQKSQKVVIKSEPADFPLILMDQEVIWQVVQNLLSNANRYSPVKSTIIVSIVKKDSMAEYSVKDEGIGIPKDQQNKIFEKFYRAENALRLVPTGSGLGLSLVKSLVEGWGGKVWFKTGGEEKGTTFYFTISLSGMKPKKGDVGITV